jgi:iron-sulfur cluster repair protein YtfE (RIC family)
MRPTEPFRQEHAELLSHLEQLARTARWLPLMEPADRKAEIAHVLRFLREALLPHAEAEEEVLYPEWAKLVGFDGAAVPMVHDHDAIVARIELLGHTDVEDVDRLQELLYGLYALIGVHFRKEEDLQLPAFDAAPPEITEAVLGRMAILAGHVHAHS